VIRVYDETGNVIVIVADSSEQNIGHNRRDTHRRACSTSIAPTKVGTSSCQSKCDRFVQLQNRRSDRKPEDLFVVPAIKSLGGNVMNWEQFFLIGRRDRVGDSFKTLEMCGLTHAQVKPVPRDTFLDYASGR